MSYVVTPEMRAVLQRDIDEGILSEPGQSVVWMLLKAYDDHVRCLRDLEAFVRELSEQGDHNALDMLDRLRRGHVDRYERARAALAKVPA